MSESLQNIIAKLWTAPDHAEWTPKTNVVSLADLHSWFTSNDIEILGFAMSTISDARFRIEPPLSLAEYKDFVKYYHERCIVENPQSQWAENRFMACATLLNIFAALWRDPAVPREILQELKVWLGHLYKVNGTEIRKCLVQATLEHLFEQEDIREFFVDWKGDPALSIAHQEASEWYLGGGSTPLGKKL